MAEDRILSDAEMIALGRGIAAELGYIRGLIDALRTAPGEVDVTMFLGRIERLVAALEAVMSIAQQQMRGTWEQKQKGQGPWEPGKDAGRFVEGLAAGLGVFGDEIIKDIASALLGEAAGSGGPASPPTRDKEE